MLNLFKKICGGKNRGLAFSRSEASPQGKTSVFIVTRLVRVQFASGLRKEGFTLVEMIIYAALMAIITIAVTQSLVVVLKSNRTSFAETNLRNSGYSAMEGMLREIYASENIDLPSATGSILQMKQNSASTTVRFAVSSSTLNFYEGSSSSTAVLIGPQTSKNILVTSLTFTKINTGKSLAVRIQMQLNTTVNGITKNEWFYGTAILRGSY